MTSTARSLDGVRVLAVEQYAAGPFATMQLVDLGADVIKIEDPTSGGDIARKVTPFASEDGSLFFETFNRGKRSVALDLMNPVGRELFESLVEQADVVFANVRGDVPAKLGLRYEDLRHKNEKIVCCFLSAFGLTGTAQDRPGYDYIMQGRAGWMSLTGEPSGIPEKSGLSLVDYVTGMAASTAMVAAVLGARRTGRGADCDLSLFDAAIGMLSYVGTWQLSRDYVATRTAHSAHPSLVPFQNFQTSDGWIVMACAKEKFWKRLTAVLGAEELASNPKFANFELRKLNKEELLAELEPLIAKRSTNGLLAQLENAGVPCGPVNDVAQALVDPIVAERGLIVETNHPSLGVVRQIAGPVRVGEYEPVRERGPFLGEHTAEVVGGLLGIDDDALDSLGYGGAFGDPSLGLWHRNEGSEEMNRDRSGS
jgi:crotonobetainyl-CoA:carnitine CoA-transferase CaiB-like acyl-CoA transferase